MHIFNIRTEYAINLLFIIRTKGCIFSGVGNGKAEILRLQRPHVQPEILANILQKPYQRENRDPESGTIAGCAPRNRISVEQRRLEYPYFEIYEKRWDVAVRGLRFCHITFNCCF